MKAVVIGSGPNAFAGAIERAGTGLSTWSCTRSRRHWAATRSARSEATARFSRLIRRSLATEAGAGSAQHRAPLPAPVGRSADDGCRPRRRSGSGPLHLEMTSKPLVGRGWARSGARCTARWSAPGHPWRESARLPGRAETARQSACFSAAASSRSSKIPSGASSLRSLRRLPMSSQRRWCAAAASALSGPSSRCRR